MTSAPLPKPQYFLMPHAYVCARDDYVVLFDVEQGKYLALTDRQSHELANLIHGWPKPQASTDTMEGAVVSGSRLGSAEPLIEKLLRRGLLTQDAGIGKSATPTIGRPTMETFPMFQLEPSLHPFLRYLPSFLVACARAKVLHRSINMLHRPLRLARLVERIQARRRRWGDQPTNDNKLRMLVTAHHHLRPLVYTVLDNCLYDCLVLIEFLAAHRTDATWVFGIHTSPWIPHCWVRSDKYLLNDGPWRVGRYSVLAEF